MKKQIKHIANILSVITALSMLAACGGNDSSSSEVEPLKNEYVQKQDDKATAYWIDGTPFTPVLRFIAGSDVHVNEDESWGWSRYRLGHLFDDIYDYAATQEYKRLDAVILNGDLCETGTELEYQTLMAEIEEHTKQQETIVMASFAGHEVLEHFYQDAESDAVEFITSYTGIDPVSHLKINGFHFVVISNMYSEAKLPAGYDKQWILNAFSQAAEDDAQQPIFTFFHHPVNDTVLFSEKDRNDYPNVPIFAEEMNNYPQMVYFSSHHHSALRHPATVVQTGLTSIDPGSGNYFGAISQNRFENVGGKTLGSSSSSHTSAAGGMHVIEVDAQNRIRIMPYNLVLRSFYNGMGEQADEQLIYYIEEPSNPSTWLYKSAGSKYATAGESRQEKSANPYFDGNAEITNFKVAAESIDFRFPQALDDDGVESYTIIVKDADGNAIIAEPISSEYYREPTPKEMQISYTRNPETYAERAANRSHFAFIDPTRENLSGTTWQQATYAFEDGKTYTLEIIAYDVWAKKSTGATQGQKSLQFTFTTDYSQADGVKKA